MITPFGHVNQARIRAEARARRLRRLIHLAQLTVLCALGLVAAHMALTTALSVEDLMARAQSLKGM